MISSETRWDLDQTLKSTIHKVNMTLSDAQNYTWFVASLTLHLRMTLSQQKISTQAEALDTAMRLQKTLLEDPGLEVQQIQAHIETQCLEMKKLK